MPSRENHGSLLPFSSFGRSIFGGARRDQARSGEGGSNEANKPEIVEFKLFHKLVTDRFQELADVGTEDLLSVAWIQKLLDAYLSCQDEFRVILMDNKEKICKPPLDRFVADFFQRSLKGLDICNAGRDGVERIRTWHKHLEIVLSALDSRRLIGEGQFRRARKGLTDLALAMLDEKESASVVSHRNRSFGRHNTGKDQASSSRPGHGRSHSWCVSQSWSAAKQLQSVASNLSPPRAVDVQATGGLLVPVSTMNYVLVFVLWALVAAIPCQDRGLQIHFSIPRQYTWGTPLLSLYDSILEESKRRDRKNSCGLLKEIYQIENCAHRLTDLVDMAQFPLAEEHKTEVEQEKKQLTYICEVLKNELDPLERQVREVFRRTMNFRSAATLVSQTAKSEQQQGKTSTRKFWIFINNKYIYQTGFSLLSFFSQVVDLKVLERYGANFHLFKLPSISRV